MAEATFAGQLAYRDPEAALDWCSRAFGFETRMLITGPDGRLIIAETGCGGRTVGIGPESEGHASPLTTGGVNTQSMHVRFGAGELDIDGHCARARGAGAKILQEPRQEFYGDLTYVCSDIEGHVWTFGFRTEAGEPPPEGWTIRFPGQEGREPA